MFRFLLPGRRVLAGAFSVPLLVSAATLRVPQDFDLIQRAILAAAPGDTISISPGTYRENLSIDNAVTIRGAGIGQTMIVAPDRAQSIVKVDHGGAVTLTGLTLAHTDPLPDTPEGDLASYAVELNIAPVVLRDIRIEKTPASYILSSTANLLTVENLAIAAEKPFVCLSLHWTLAGTRLERVSFPEQNWGTAIEVENGAAEFRDLTVNPSQRAGIRISGAVSDVKFPDLAPEMLARIEWSGASPDGPQRDQIDEYQKETLKEQMATRASLDEYRLEQRAKEVARGQLLHEFQASLRKSSTSAAAIAAFAELLPKLYRTFIGENGYSDERVTAVIRMELRALHARFGPAVLAKALELPDYDKQSLDYSRTTYLAPDLLDSLAALEAEQWVNANIPDLAALLANWKKAPPSAPVAARDAFLEMLQTLSTKIAAGAPDKATTALRKLALAELPPFSARHGAAGLDELLRSLGLKPTALLSLEQTRAALTPDQKNSLVQYWKTH